LIALVAAVAGPWATIRATRRQAEAQLSATNIQVLAARETAAAQLDAQHELNKAQLQVSADLSTKRIRAEVVSANRQVWINGLRDAIADLQSVLLYAANAVYEGGAATVAEINEKAERAHYNVARIELFLNPSEKEHERLATLLVDQMHKLDELVQARQAGARSVDPALEPLRDDVLQIGLEIRSITKKILKAEWERVKTGE
jgi:hypothetical protein